VLQDLQKELTQRLHDTQTQIHTFAGHAFNIASPKQLGVVLFEELKVHESLKYDKKLAKTTLGYKTDASVLQQFKSHPCVQLILEYRELSKLLGTYVERLPELVNPKTGRIHTQFHQIGTVTGRLSSSDPNLQNIPIRTSWGKKVRSAFAACDDRHWIVSADYSQIDLRVLACLSKDPNMIKAFQQNQDIHRETAAAILGKNPADITPDERSKAKAVNFGIIYGMGANRLAREHKISLAEAQAFIEKYFLNFFKIKDYVDGQIQKARDTAVVHTFFGRPRPLVLQNTENRRTYGSAAGGLTTENMAVNSPIQGTSADIMKWAMLNVDKAFQDKNLKAKMILQVHDELVFEVPDHELETVVQLVKQVLEKTVQFEIPFCAEVHSGRNWKDTK